MTLQGSTAADDATASIGVVGPCPSTESATTIVVSAMLDPTIDARKPGVLEIDSDAVEAVEMELFLEKLDDLTT